MPAINNIAFYTKKPTPEQDIHLKNRKRVNELKLSTASNTESNSKAPDKNTSTTLDAGQGAFAVSMSYIAVLTDPFSSRTMNLPHEKHKIHLNKKTD